jgi:hypothetical protein
MAKPRFRATSLRFGRPNLNSTLILKNSDIFLDNGELREVLMV